MNFVQKEAEASVIAFTNRRETPYHPTCADELLQDPNGY